MELQAFLYGQVLGTHSFFMKEGFPKEDEYAEIERKTFLPGGETGTAATVLSSLGVRVRVSGTHIGREVAPMLRAFYADTRVDLSSLYFDDSYEGLMDYVIVSGLSRTPMGMFRQLYEAGIPRWSMPEERTLRNASWQRSIPFFWRRRRERRSCA